MLSCCIARFEGCRRKYSIILKSLLAKHGSSDTAKSQMGNSKRLQESELYAETMSVYGPHKISAHHERFIKAATHLGEFAQATLGIAIDTEFYTKPDPEVLPFGHIYSIGYDEASQSFLQVSNKETRL